MSSRISEMPNNLDWKQAYLAAILEKNHALAVELIQHAAEKLSARQHELIQEGCSTSDEAEAIHDAYYMLQALHTSMSHRDTRITR